MSMLIGSATVAVVVSTRTGMHVECYETRLDAVLRIINNGALGGGYSYGDADHKAALDAVERQIAETRQCIAEYGEIGSAP